MGNHGTSAKISSHTESGWRLNELTEGAVKIELGACSDIFRLVLTRTIFSKAPTRTLQNFERVTSQAWPHWWNKKEAGVQTQSLR